MRPRDDKNIHVHVNLSGFELRLDRIEHAIRHLPTGGTDPTVQQTLERIENRMSALTDAVVAMKARIDEDVAHLRALLDEALAANAGDAAEIARITAEADEAVAAITAIDPVAEFPEAPPA